MSSGWVQTALTSGKGLEKLISVGRGDREVLSRLMVVEGGGNMDGALQMVLIYIEDCNYTFQHKRV